MKRVAISACLTGKECRYDASDNYDEKLLDALSECRLIPFCPEDNAFGSPRPTMDLIKCENGIKALSNLTGEDLTAPIEHYAKEFFVHHKEVDLYIGKDRSPSCGVKSAKLYDREKNLLESNATGLMSKEAIDAGVESWDAEEYLKLRIQN